MSLDFRKLNTHKRIHFDYRPHKCNICKKGFNTQIDLVRHAVRHTKTNQIDETTQFMCTECNIGFNIEKDLKIHSSIHNRNGTYNCNECNKDFESK